MDFKQERSGYLKTAYADKRITVLALLKGLQGKGEVFDSIFSYIASNPEWALEVELDEIFEMIMLALESDNEELLQEKIAKLDGLQGLMRKMREDEDRERAEENPEEILMPL